MKTIKQWFNEGLSPSDAEKAIKYTAEDVLNTECESFDDALVEGFVWDKTPEGADYWDSKCHLQ